MSKGHAERPDALARYAAILEAAAEAGWLGRKTSRIAGRVSQALVGTAKRRTGIDADTDLIEFALANIALDDGFADAFKQARGSVDPDLDLGF